MLIFACGTRGDMEPMCCLASEMSRRGHVVAVATEARLAPVVAARAVDHVALAGDMTGSFFDSACLEARARRLRGGPKGF